MALEYFNIVFAFAVVMLLFSLVITVMVQIVVAVGGLRGRNLLWAVTRVLDRIPVHEGYTSEIAEKLSGILLSLQQVRLHDLSSGSWSRSDVCFL